MNSAIYAGWVRHRRLAPVENAFRYRVFMMYLDLAELPRLFDRRWLWSAHRPAPAWFRRADHVGDPARPLDECIRDLVARDGGERPAGAVRLLTHLRYFGYVFNPVSFYYCFDAEDRQVEAIVAEVTNTPWGERHCYVMDRRLDCSDHARVRRYRFAKDFHVSPFQHMDVDYDWRFTPPGERLIVHNDSRRGGEKFFDCTLSLQRREIGAASLAGALARHPLMTLQVTGLIHWQALRLWLKRVPYIDHPKDTQSTGAT